MSQATESRLLDSTLQDDLAAYLLGIGIYAYRDRQPYLERYERLVRAVRSLTRSLGEDDEARILRYGAQIAQVNRVVAAQFVESALEAVATGPNWTHLSEARLFRIARDLGCLFDYISFARDFAVPTSSEHFDPLARYFLFAEHFQGLPDGAARQGLRLGLVALFDRDTDAVAAGLALCDRLRGSDPALDLLSSQRLLLALERGEIAGYGAAYHDLGARMVAAAGRWGMTAALPYLYRMLEATTTRDRSSRVLRALLLRAIEQLARS
jgi:hypothetical protein